MRLAIGLPDLQYSKRFVPECWLRTRSRNNSLTSARIMSRTVFSGQPMARRLAMYGPVIL